MGAESRRHVILVGLEIKDDLGYARYRAEMMPILESYGGAFGVDVVVSKVLRGGNDGLNRLFTISFPDRATRERFFADERYRAIRTEFFEPSVAAGSLVLGEFDVSDTAK